MTLPFFTFGGMFYWVDRHSRSGWRIQQNIWSKRCRLLDNYNIRRASGNFEACLEKMNYFLKAWEVTSLKKEAVVLIHGLFQSVSSFDRIALTLKNEGVEVILLSFPQLRYDLSQSAQILNDLLNRRDDLKKIHFVAYGAGGLILRKALSSESVWKKNLGRSVLIGVPNQGFIWAHKWQNKWWYKSLFGHMASNITPDFIADNVPKMVGEFCTIAGGKENDKGLLPFFFKRDNDGVLTVDETKHEGSRDDYLVIGAFHFSMQKNASVIELMMSFLKHGRFGKGKRIRKETSYVTSWDD